MQSSIFFIIFGFVVAVAVGSPTPYKPLTWPEGMYGLQMPKTGCPKGTAFQWQVGTRYHDTEDYRSKNEWSSSFPAHFAGNIGRNNMEQKFCIKTQATPDSLPWPKGEYCILKKGQCPAGFQSGYIEWDDEDRRNKNSRYGVLPDGVYGRNTRIFYCCRSDGHARHAISLPTDSPFVLLKSSTNDVCQEVSGMRWSSEYFKWDCEDFFPNNDHGGHIPHSVIDRNIRIDYCYYYR